MKNSIFFLSILFFGCGPSSEKTKNDSVSISDSIPNKTGETKPDNGVPFGELHLRDTTFVHGNQVIFLRPDSARFEHEAKNKIPGVYEADSDFGVAIAAAIDTIFNVKSYSGIKAMICMHRYIVVKDCKNGPQILDRDTLNYGIILTAKGKEIKMEAKGISGAGYYLKLVRDYFNLKK